MSMWVLHVVQLFYFICIIAVDPLLSSYKLLKVNCFENVYPYYNYVVYAT